MNHVFHRHLHTTYPTAVKGDGCYIIDSTGKRYFDGSCGAAVSCLGHSNAEVIKAIEDQIHKIPFAHTGFFTNEPAEQLADLLIEHAPEGLERVYFFSGGSEAAEASIKIARQYFLEIGKPEKSKIIARQQSYHGNTLGALAAGGNQWRRKQFEPLLVEMYHIEPCYEYRFKKDDETEEQFGIRMANQLENMILKIGAEKVAAFMAEPVVGATMGCVPAAKGYFKRIREICDKYDVLLILDEVMCGMGRTGYYYACEFDGITADLLCIAKGLGAGYQPIGAMLVSGKIYDAIYKGTGFFQHGHTYIAHATACAASLKVQQIIHRDKLLENVKNMGNLLRKRLEETFGNHKHIGNIRGRGLFQGLEIVEDRATKKPFDPAKKINGKIKAKAMEEGLMCYPMGGTIDGLNGDHVMLAPPFIITEKQVDEVVEKLSKAISAVI